MEGSQPPPIKDDRKGNPTNPKSQTMDAKNEKAHGNIELVKRLSMRCTQFLNSMSQLNDTWQAAEWFGDLFNTTELHETISFERLKDFLIGFIAEIKNRNDVQIQSQRATEDWLISEITYISQMLKKEPQNSPPQPQTIPQHLDVVLKDVKHMISTIHAKLDADSKYTKQHDKQLPSDQSSTSKAKNQATSSNARIKALEKDNHQLSKDLEQRGKVIKEREEELKKVQHSNAELSRENSMLKGSVVEIDALKSRLQKADSDLVAFQSLEKKCREAEQKVSQLTQENKDLQQRYSALAGAKMSHENPDIADLSDPYRPTKIAEMFSELYDNQWTDGFAALAKHGDERAIQTLMSLLKETNTFCKNEIQSLRQRLRSNILETCTLQVTSKQTPQRGGQADLVKDRRIDDIIRDNAMLPVNLLKQKFLRQSETKRQKLKTDKTGAKHVIEYVEKCVELCWLMAIQSPPVAIDDDVEEYRNKQLDERRFKHFTRKGQVIDYVVWPILLIQGGGMLGKGVAQCK